LGDVAINYGFGSSLLIGKHPKMDIFTALGLGPNHEATIVEKPY
jgi:hypothetical protein